MNIFTYGSLMFPSVMRAVTDHEFPSLKARLRDYARYKVIGEAYPGLTPLEGAVTEGVLYLDVDVLSVRRLDDFEGEFYERTQIPAETLEGDSLTANTYVIKAKYLDRLSSEPWDPECFEKFDLFRFLTTYRGFVNAAVAYHNKEKA